MKKTLLTLALLASTSVFAHPINCVFETTDHEKVTGSEIAIQDLKADGNARIIKSELYGETWIVSAVNVGSAGNIIVTASKLAEVSAISGIIKIDSLQPSLSVSIKTDGTVSASVAQKSTLPNTTNHLFCEAN